MNGSSSPIDRDARDRVARCLGLGLPHPLRDLDLVYPAKVDLNARADIRIIDGQRDVRYRLCDEEGNLLFDAEGKEYSAVRGPAGVILVTPEIKEDVTYTILATQSDSDRDLVLEGSLAQSLSIQVGINEALKVAFVPGPGQISDDTRLVAAYGDLATIAVFATQEGVSYRLVLDPVPTGPELTPVIGNKGVLHLVTGQLTGNLTIRVHAFRTTDPDVEADLTTVLSVIVRPDPSVEVKTVPVIEYDTVAQFVIPRPQPNATYRLYRHEIAREEYLPGRVLGVEEAGRPLRRSRGLRAVRAVADSKGGPAIEVPVDDGRTILLRRPATITNWEQLGDFVPDAAFEVTGDQTVATSPSIKEDTIFVVRATNNDGQETLQLDQVLAVLVRPNPGPAVDVDSTVVPPGDRGLFSLRGTQKGVQYQLRSAPNGIPVGRPGFHYEDRGIGRERVKVDLEVGRITEQRVLLPTDPIDVEGTFDILATKTLTGLNKVLTATATQAVTIVADIRETLPVAFEPGPGQQIIEGRLMVYYGDKATVVVSETQEAVKYRLVLGPAPGGVELKPEVGNGGDLRFETGPLTGNNVVRVHAFREAHPEIAADLSTVLSILVQPIPSVAVETVPVIEYGAVGRFVIPKPQPNATYQLYRRDITLDEYLPEDPQPADPVRTLAPRARAVRADPFIHVPVDGGRVIRLRRPNPITKWDQADGFTTDATFELKEGKAIADSPDLKEDTLFVVRATNNDGQFSLPLDQVLPVLVRPNPGPTVSVEPAVVKAGATGRVVLGGTQKGVEYQLRIEADGSKVGRPGFHVTDRAIESTRVEVDLEVEGNSDERLLLPTGPLEATTTFDILATKTVTGLTQQLTGRATFTLEKPPEERERPVEVEERPADERPAEAVPAERLTPETKPVSEPVAIGPARVPARPSQDRPAPRSAPRRALPKPLAKPAPARQKPPIRKSAESPGQPARRSQRLAKQPEVEETKRKKEAAKTTKTRTRKATKPKPTRTRSREESKTKASGSRPVAAKAKAKAKPKRSSPSAGRTGESKSRRPRGP